MYDARTENASPIPILNVYQLARPCDRALWPLCRPLAASRPARGQSGSRSRAHVPLCGTIGPVRGCWSVSCSVSVQPASKNDFTSGAALARTQRCREPNFVRRAIDEGQRSMQWPTGDHLSTRGPACAVCAPFRTPAAALLAALPCYRLLSVFARVVH